MVLDPLSLSNDDFWSDGTDHASYSTDGNHDWDSPYHDQHKHNDPSHPWEQHHDNTHDDHLHPWDQFHDQGHNWSWHSSPEHPNGIRVGDDDHYGSYFVHQNFDPNHPQGIVIGAPGHDLQSWHPQHRPDDCAIVAQQSILESLSGKQFSENTLCTEAQLEGCYYPGAGTPLDHVGHLLENWGIPLEHHYGGTLADLSDKLAHGEKVIVAVNSAELWQPDQNSIIGQTLSSYPGIPGQPANHAVVVTGIVYPTSDPLHPQIVLNDSGNSNGGGMMVPWEQFEKAWSSSHYYMVSTTVHNSDGIHLDAHNNSFDAISELTSNQADRMMLGLADVSIDDSGYVHRNGSVVAHFNGCTLVNADTGKLPENSLGTIAIYDSGSGYIRDGNYNIIGSLDSFGNVYRSSSSFPIATNCHSIRKATVLVLYG